MRQNCKSFVIIWYQVLTLYKITYENAYDFKICTSAVKCWTIRKVYTPKMKDSDRNCSYIVFKTSYCCFQRTWGGRQNITHDEHTYFINDPLYFDENEIINSDKVKE